MRGPVSSQVSSWLNFSPMSLTPLVWYDASDTSTITESGGFVSQWDDKSGNGRNVTQGTGIKQPVTGLTTQNGLNVISFDGINDSLAFSSFPTTVQPFTIVAMFNWNSTADNNRLISLNNNVQIFIYNSKFSPFAGGLTSAGLNQTTSPGLRITTFDGSSTVFYVDSNAGVTINPGTNSATGILRIAARADDSLYGNLNVYEIFVVNRRLSLYERDSILAYSRAKWGTP